MNQKKNNIFTRRQFLKGFGGGAMGAAVVPRLFPQETASLETRQGKVPVYDKKLITLTVNGKTYSLVAHARDSLLGVLREKLNLTGAKKVCDRGECGGCTVLLENNPVYACLYPAVRASGKSITTVEGLSSDRGLHPVQKAFIAKDGYQCGFCTSGFIMSSVALLQKTENPDLDTIKESLSGNLCRCGNYFKIYEAVSEAAQKMRRS